jgi:hypothetical protein
MTRPVFCLTIVLFFFCIPFSDGQTRSELKELFFESEASVLYEEWMEALPGYLRLKEVSPENFNYSYRIGLCYLNIPGEKEKSLPYLQDAVRNINPEYQEGRYREQGAPYDALYHLASAYQINNQPAKAIEIYAEFLNGMDYEVYDSIIVKMQIESCRNALALMAAPQYLKETNLSYRINGEFSEFNPVLSADESVMVFSRKLPFYTAPFFTRKINGRWTDPQELTGQLQLDNGISTALSHDGTELYLYRSDNYDGNIYVSTFADNVWSPAEKLNGNINTIYWESHASISADGKKLYFTSNRKGGYGGLDIYVSTRDSSGYWGPAVNLGPVINTPYNEDTPFPDQSGRTIFFSSRGHYNMGGHDIFYSTMMDDTTWAVPLNMGYPVNSTDDDIFYSPVGEGYIAYRSKFDPNGYGEQDIFRLEVFSDNHPRKFRIRGIATLKDLLTNFRDSIKISALNSKNLDTLVVVYSNPETGEYEFEIPHGNYRVEFEATGSEKKIEELNLELTREGDTVRMNKIVLPKTDFEALLNIRGPDSATILTSGEKATILLDTEPASTLKVEWMVGDSLISTELFMVNASLFEYELIPTEGNNRLIFTLKDRFNNITTREFALTAHKRAIIPTRTEQIDFIEEEPETPIAVTNQEQTADPSIDSMTQALSGATEDDPGMQEAIMMTTARDIRNAGEWLETLYSLATEDEQYREKMLLLISAMSAEDNITPEQYLSRLAGFASGDLRDFILKTAAGPSSFKSIEDALQYLFDSASENEFSKKEIFETLARLIANANKSADQIMDYIEKSPPHYGWLLIILLTGATSMIFIVSYRKKKKREDR